MAIKKSTDLTKVSPKSPFRQYDFVVNGYRYCGSTKQTEKGAAERVAKLIRRKALDEAAARRLAGPMKDMTWGASVISYRTMKGDYKSASKDERAFKWLTEQIGENTFVSEIDNPMLAKLIQRRRGMNRFGNPDNGRISDASLNIDVTGPIRKVLKHVKFAEHVVLPREPYYGKHMFKGRPRVREMVIDEEMQLEDIRPDVWPCIKFMLLTGSRKQAALLTWDQVFWRQGVIHVVGKDDKFQEVLITPEVADLLRAEHKKRDRVAESHRHKNAVFTWECRRDQRHRITKELYVKGSLYPLEYDGLTTAWRVLCARAGVKDLHIHDVRKTTGARIVRCTGDLLAASKVLNHSSIALTATHYSHITPDDIRRRLDQTAAEMRRLRSLSVPSSDPHLRPE